MIVANWDYKISNSKAADAYNISASTVVNRSRSVKWPDWLEFKYEFNNDKNNN